MKKIFKLLMLVVIATGTVACSHDTTEAIGVNVGDKSQLTLSLDGVRTQLGAEVDGHYPLTWGENDQISVNGSISEPLTIENGAGKSSAIFTFDETLQTPYFIAYPAVEVANQVKFAATQYYSSDTSFENGVATMYAYSESGVNVELQHLTGVFKIGILGDATLAQLRISTIDRKPIAGIFTINPATGKVAPTADVSEVITYSFGEGGKKLDTANTTYVYITVPEGVYGELYVVLEAVNGGVMYKTIATDSTKPVDAGMVRELTDNITFTPTATTDAHLIANYGDLKAFKAAAEGGSTLNAVLVNDIEVGSDWAPINAPAYTGTFNGNGYVIKGLKAPLFETTAASFKGLHLVVDVEEKVNPNFGAFARKLAATTDPAVIEHCTVSGTIKINTDVTPETEDIYADGATGGFVGIATNVEIDNCVNNAAIELVQYSTTKNMQGVIGGVVGLSDGNVAFINCTNNATLKYSDATGKTHLNMGGIIGVCIGQGAIIAFDNCTNNGNIVKTAESAARNGKIGGIVSTISGETDESTNSARKDVTFTDNTVNKGSISTDGNIASLMIGGIFGTIDYYVNVTFNGPATNYGIISHAGTATSHSNIGGVMGHIIQGVKVQLHDNLTNAENATITVSATHLNGTSYTDSNIGGIIGSLTHLDSGSGRVDSNIYVKGITICNNAKITFSGQGKDVRIGGYVGYNYMRFSYLSGKAKVVNNGEIEIAEDASITSCLSAGGIAGQINRGNVRGTAWTDAETGQVANIGNIYFKGNAVAICIGGIIGRSYGGHNYTYIVNTGNIYAIGQVTGTSYKVIGGIAGRVANSGSYHQCQAYCDIFTNIDGVNVGMMSGTTKTPLW